MRILAIETSTAKGSVAVVEGGKVLSEARFQADRGHNTAVFGPLERILSAGGAVGGIARIVVGTGPGSYSGVRVGIAVANALSLAFRVPVAGMASLVAPGEMEGPDYWVTGDARRQSWFLARVRGWRGGGEIELLPADAFRRRVASLLDRGEIVVTFDEQAPSPVAGLAIRLESPRAGVLGQRAAGMGEAEWEELSKAPLEPIYLRAPYITAPRKK